MNRNNLLPKKIIDITKDISQKNYLKNPNSSVFLFENELKKMGFEFEVSMQIKQFLPEYKEIILPIAIKYYKQTNKDNEKIFFLDIFGFGRFEEVIPILIEDFYLSETSDSTRWFISDCFYNIKSRKYINDYLKIISNPSFGINRQMIILLLGKLKIESAISILIDLLKDEQVQLQAIIALGNYKRIELKPYFEEFVGNKQKSLSKAATSALKKLQI